MRQARFPFGLLLLAGLVVLGGCTPEEPGPAVLAIESVGASGEAEFTRAPVYDFGPVFASSCGTAGRSETQTLILHNRGGTEMPLTGLTVTKGDASLVSFAQERGPTVFHVPLDLTTPLAPGEERAIELRFAPSYALEGPAALEFEVELTLTAANTRPGEESAVISLKGMPVYGSYDLPNRLDFGTVVVGDTVPLEFSLDNPSKFEQVVFIGEVESRNGDEAPFRLQEDSARGDTPVPPGGEARVHLAFSPAAAGDFWATLKVRPDSCGPTFDVLVTGKAVERMLTWRAENEQLCVARDTDGTCLDTFVDCGTVALDTDVSVERTVTFLNAGKRAVEVSGLRFSRYTSEFSILGEAGVNSPLVVPASGEAQVRVACRRSEVGEATALLTGDTDLSSQSSIGPIQVSVVGAEN